MVNSSCHLLAHASGQLVFTHPSVDAYDNVRSSLDPACTRNSCLFLVVCVNTLTLLSVGQSASEGHPSGLILDLRMPRNIWKAKQGCLPLRLLGTHVLSIDRHATHLHASMNFWQALGGPDNRTRWVCFVLHAARGAPQTLDRCKGPSGPERAQSQPCIRTTQGVQSHCALIVGQTHAALAKSLKSQFICLRAHIFQLVSCLTSSTDHMASRRAGASAWTQV